MKSYFKIPFKPEFTELHGYNLPGEADAAKLRVLLCFPSEPGHRVLSRTHDVLYEYIKESFGGRVFVDFAFESQETQATSKKGLDEWHGVITGAKMSAFDVVGVSLAVSGPEMVRTFKHLYPRNPASKQFFVLGGAAADTAYAMYPLFDAVVLGFAEGPLAFLLSTLLGKSSDGVKALEVLNRHPHIVVPSLADSAYVKRPNVDILPEQLTVPTLPHVLPYTQGVSRAVLPITIGCLGRACTFCHEGCVQGVLRSSNLDYVKGLIAQAKKSTMADSISFQSCSFNLHPHAKEILIEAARHFRHIQSLNFRADGIVSDPELLPLLKKLDVNTVAFGVEGISDRLRTWMNKGLSNETLLAAAAQVFELGFAKLKMGFIRTGYENRSDITEFHRTIKDLKLIAKRYNARTRIQITYTDLIHYPGTPMYRHPRRLAAFLLGLPSIGVLTDKEIFGDLEGVTVQYAEGAGKNYITQFLFDLEPSDGFELLKFLASTQVPLGSKSAAELVVAFLHGTLNVRYKDVLTAPARKYPRPQSVKYMATYGDDVFGESGPASCRDGCVSCPQCTAIGNGFVPDFSVHPALQDHQGDRMKPSFLTAMLLYFGKEYAESDKESLFRSYLARRLGNPQDFIGIAASSTSYLEMQRYPSHHSGLEYFYVHSTVPLALATSGVYGLDLDHLSVQDLKVLPELYAEYTLSLTPYEVDRAVGIFNEFRKGATFSYRDSIHRHKYQAFRPEFWYEVSPSGITLYQKAGINPVWYLTHNSSLKVVQDVATEVTGFYTYSSLTKSLFNVMTMAEVGLSALQRVGSCRLEST